jgi:cytochrome c
MPRYLSTTCLTLGLLLAACGDATPPRANAVPGGDADRGRRVIASYGCGGCHTIPGITGARGGVGPSLAEFAARAYIAGELRNEPQTLVRWIRFPQELREGSAMPTLGVTDGHARDIAAYLYTLDRGGLGPPHLLPPDLLPAH